MRLGLVRAATLAPIACLRSRSSGFSSRTFLADKAAQSCRYAQLRPNFGPAAPVSVTSNASGGENPTNRVDRQGQRPQLRQRRRLRAHVARRGRIGAYLRHRVGAQTKNARRFTAALSLNENKAGAFFMWSLQTKGSRKRLPDWFIASPQSQLGAKGCLAVLRWAKTSDAFGSLLTARAMASFVAV